MPPGAERAKYFLTTERLQITQFFDRKLQDLKVGDSILRTVSMIAENTVGMTLPPPWIRGPRGYPGLPRHTQDFR
jgi:hypothetical protein